MIRDRVGVETQPTVQTDGRKREKRQFVKFAFFKLDPMWRRLKPEQQAADKQEFIAAIQSFGGRMLLRSYSLVGIRGDVDFLLWLVAERVDVFQEFATVLFSTNLGKYLTSPYSYLSMTRRSIYEFKALPGDDTSRITIQPTGAKYLFVYPFVKTRPWYRLSLAERQRMMDEHVEIGRRYPSVKLNTTYSFGLDDQEFVVAFETDDPSDFLDLVMELRESEASSFTLRDTPTFTCIQMSLVDVLDSLGGAQIAGRTSPVTEQRPDGFTRVAARSEVKPGTSKLVYLGGEAVALFNVDGEFHAIGNRCTHARGSLCDGTVEDARVTCAWHGAQFDLKTGQPIAGPARAPVPVYQVKIEDDQILVGPVQR